MIRIGEHQIIQFKKIVKKFHFVPQKVHQKRTKKDKKGKNNDKGGKGGNSKQGKESKDPVDVIIEPLELPATAYINQSVFDFDYLKHDGSKIFYCYLFPQILDKLYKEGVFKKVLLQQLIL